MFEKAYRLSKTEFNWDIKLVYLKHTETDTTIGTQQEGRGRTNRNTSEQCSVHGR